MNNADVAHKLEVMTGPSGLLGIHAPRGHPVRKAVMSDAVFLERWFSRHDPSVSSLLHSQAHDHAFIDHIWQTYLLQLLIHGDAKS